MSYIIQVKYDDRVRYLNRDDCGWHTTRRARARTFSTPEEARETAQILSPSFRSAYITVVPFKESRVWRKVVDRKRCLEEHSSVRGRYFSWRAIPVNTLTLECGHTKVVRGDSAPLHRTVCKECEENRTT